MKGVNTTAFEEMIAANKNEGMKLSRVEWDMINAYETSKECQFGQLVIKEGPWNSTAEEIELAMTGLGIESFVIVDQSTALMNMVHTFIELGYMLVGTPEISQEGKPYFHPEYDKPLKGLHFVKCRG